MSDVTALFLKTRCKLANSFRIARDQSTFKWVFVLLFASSLVIGLWALFYHGFVFLDSLGGPGFMIIHRLFSLFFMAMGGMLVISGIVTSYATVFRSDEIPFLITGPFHISSILLYKFFESSALSSWAFFFIVVPFVGAYAQYQEMTMFFPVVTLLFSIPYLLLCSGIGTMITLVAVRAMPRGQILKAMLCLLAVGAGLFAWWLLHEANAYMDDEATFMLSKLVPGFRLSSNAVLPSWWLAEGVDALTKGFWLRGSMLFAVMLSNCLVLCLLIAWLGGKIFYRAWLGVSGASGLSSRKALSLPWLDRSLDVIARNTRALILKDVRTFLRDPMQWSQVLIFFGLLALYFANLRSFRYHMLPDKWRNTIALLNAFSVSAVMCSLGSRFIYPQLSLEGQSFWVIGLSPTNMKKVLLTKFGISAISLGTVSMILMAISTRMLGLEPIARWITMLLAIAMSIAISALSVGLGALFIDLQQRNPSVIVSGFGGTLNLVLCLAFMLATIVPIGLLLHLQIMDQISERQMLYGLGIGLCWVTILTTFATLVPLTLGINKLKRQEM